MAYVILSPQTNVMNTETPRTDEAAVDVWRKSNGERMATSSDKVDADFARKLERELNEARAETIRTREFMDYGFAKAQEELTDMTAQRDRLAEALDKVVDAWDHAEWLDENDFESVRAALQSLTQKP
jgi:hypothetical protein